ncbi:hypothetical protein CI238_06875 [Colletotrichum incanum]|uniref:Uncharacterized protein n=1 Tax=Colletotrichum incanum TaxID=1573173 RepID=A0A166ZKY9_COLIC|nr:hypothetical protein CI238_06875 [Colletotrichum incanum]
MGEIIAFGKTLINKCRTLVEANKPLTAGVAFDNQATDRLKIDDEHAKTLGLVEGELRRCKETASSELQQKPSCPSGSDLADIQAQLNAVKNSLAVVVQNQWFNPTERGLGTTLSPINQIALNRPPRIGQNAPSANSRNSATVTAAAKKEN